MCSEAALHSAKLHCAVRSCNAPRQHQSKQNWDHRTHRILGASWTILRGEYMHISKLSLPIQATVIRRDQVQFGCALEWRVKFLRFAKFSCFILRSWRSACVTQASVVASDRFESCSSHGVYSNLPTWKLKTTLNNSHCYQWELSFMSPGSFLLQPLAFSHTVLAVRFAFSKDVQHASKHFHRLQSMLYCMPFEAFFGNIRELAFRTQIFQLT